MKRSHARWIGPLTLFGASLLAGACGSEAPPAEPAAAPPAAAAPAPPAASSARRVYFVQPTDGATVKSPVKLVYGIENYGLGAVPPGEVKEARPGLGHHHVAVDAACLPVGTVIPKAAPWVHHGDGKTEIDMQLPPGKHTLTLQLGDDLHTTMTDLCTTITVNVVE
jgi:hypothetical protein